MGYTPPFWPSAGKRTPRPLQFSTPRTSFSPTQHCFLRSRGCVSGTRPSVNARCWPRSGASTSGCASIAIRPTTRRR
ncbi:hypothetical protein CPLU01_10821 [Colletotrichum plurivorum]|uniref:Uncharacterized protein n=1 Tax=Colletotrichum plurivorum TaxID=2175906 RepID=A0A8H6N9N7_9PEZI|nr:hypothetical protein CPLU01_10821 [Colletotrichum plurivorum]